ncbi:MAG: IS3 family transposase, partial [Pseudonocardiales bacterium]|nr:IS3 family transposase [Pseudonocardiales bacterium]
GHSIGRCGDLFEVSRAAYYQRRQNTPSARDLTDAELTTQIRRIHTESKGTYGTPRVTAELRRAGEVVSRRRVGRLMRRVGLEGRAKKKWRTTTIPDPDAAAAADRIRRVFAPGGPADARYVGDITDIATWEGWAFPPSNRSAGARLAFGWATSR